jgi:hypothetical protein
MSNAQALIRKIEALPPERLAEVEDFVDFLTAKARRLAAMDRLLAVAPALEAVGAPPITEDESQAEVDAVRDARRRGPRLRPEAEKNDALPLPQASPNGRDKPNHGGRGGGAEEPAF